MHDDSVRVGWISPSTEADKVALLSGLTEDQRRIFPWTLSRFAFGNDRETLQAIHAAASSHDGFIVSGLSLTQIESLFNLRALQLLDRQARYDMPSVIILEPGSSPTCFHRLGDRMRSGWPFRSALFVGDPDCVERLRNEGLFALAHAEANRHGLAALLERRDGAFESMLADQVLAVQFQPAWFYGGSHTVFSNQIEAMLDRGWFVLRIIVEPEGCPGPTMRRRIAKFVEETNVDATTHIDTLACATGLPPIVDDREADEYLRHSIRGRINLVIPDDLMSDLVARADIAVINYVYHMGFALTACPAAKYVLETHDDITCMRLTQWRVLPEAPAFSAPGTLKRHLRLERLAWRTVDVCIALSLSDLRKIRRHASRFVFVLPRPYARPALKAGPDALWDILIVMNPHHFNVPALDRFLNDVIACDPVLANLRIAIAGRVNEVLEADWKHRLPATRWFGFVPDIDSLRDSSRISVCPDEHGTGIAIKTLTAMAAGHPMIATPTALRGLPDEILELIPPANGAAEMQNQIGTLLSDESLLEQRRNAVAVAAGLLWPATGHGQALSMAMESGPGTSRRRADFLASLGQELPPPPINLDERCIRFGAGGNDRPFLGRNWLNDEPGGRWSDGSSATVRLPGAWMMAACRLKITFMESFQCTRITLRHRGISLKGRVRSPGKMTFDLDLEDRAHDDVVELEISCPAAFCPSEDGIGNDERVLGMHIRTIEIVPQPWHAALIAGVRKKFGDKTLVQRTSA